MQYFDKSRGSKLASVMSINNSFLVKKTKSFAAVELEFFFWRTPCKENKNCVNKRPRIKTPTGVETNFLGFLCFLTLTLYCGGILMKFWTLQVATPGVKQGPASQAAPQQPVIADKQAGHEPASPRSLQRSRYIEVLLCSVISFFSAFSVCCMCCS